ncbi:MAG: ATPase, T2SS/T4P/T4SS family, partial [Lachnospiraceae bacterium]|nr:ATPase, T2SS/T4P/T4SS family [Lachnospiraceae bacterium]
MDDTQELQELILKQLDMSTEVEDEKLEEVIHQVLQQKGRDQYLSLQEKVNLGKELFNTFRKLDLLQEIIEDDEITEIMINGIQNIFIEKYGKIIQLEKRFASKAKLEDVIQQIVSGCNRLVNEASPIVDARLPDGSRVNVVLQPIALNGPIVTIRKFPKEVITMKQLIVWNSITNEVAEILSILVKAKF